MAVCCEFLGAATGTAVAITIGKGIVYSEFLSMRIVLAGAGAIVIWAVLATYYGMPISLTHGLVAGLVDAGIANGGRNIIEWSVLGRVVSAVGIAPLLGFTGGFLVMVAIMWIFQRSAPEKLRIPFRNLQIASSAFLAYSHGKNDGQMPIGLIAMALMAYRSSGQFIIPFWAVVVSATSISLGTAVGGWRVISTMGLKITKLQPVQGFAATIAAASVIETVSHLGIPVSTTHCASNTIMGIGATKRLSAVRWGIAKKIVMTWIITFPACAILGWLIATVLKLIS
jgi:PiT family inorganic phosphate transporter